MAGISRDGLHAVLWLRRGANGALRVEQNRLADELQVTKYAMSRVINRMVAEGRLKPVKGSRPNQTPTFEVVDPSEWRSPEV